MIQFTEKLVNMMSQVRSDQTTDAQMDIKMHPAVRSYLPLVKYIAGICGENCEVVLHDLTDMEHSVVAGENLYITGRKIGDSMTNFALKVVFNEAYTKESFIVNYKATNSDGSRVFKSSTFYIRDENHNIVGLLCTNYDVTLELEMQKHLEQLTRFTDLTNNARENKASTLAPDLTGDIGVEKFLSSKEETLNDIIETTLSEYAIPVSRMKVEEKKDVVRDLRDKGTFNLKSAVSFVADKLEVSEPTIYRYLKEINNH